MTGLFSVRPPKHFNNAQVIGLDPLGRGLTTIPRELEVRLEDGDGAPAIVMWYGKPSISLGDFVRIRLDGTDTETYIIEGLGGNTAELTDEPLTTGLTLGGEITANLLDFDIEAGGGLIIDSWSFPGDVVNTRVVWGAFTAEATIGPDTYVFIDSGGNVVKQSNADDNDLRTKIFLGIVSRDTANTFILVFNNPKVAYQTGNYLFDLFYRVGTNLIDGAVSPNSDLTLNLASGDIFGPSINWHNDQSRPNIVVLAGENPMVFTSGISNGFVAQDITILDVGNYENPLGTVAAIPGANTRAAIWRVYKMLNGADIILYPQFFYDNLDTAAASLGVDNINFTFNPVVEGFGILTTYIVATKGATNLSLATDAVFLYPDTPVSGGGGGGGTNPNYPANGEIRLNGTLFGDLSSAITVAVDGDEILLGGGLFPSIALTIPTSFNSRGLIITGISKKATSVVVATDDTNTDAILVQGILTLKNINIAATFSAGTAPITSCLNLDNPLSVEIQNSFVTCSSNAANTIAMGIRIEDTTSNQAGEVRISDTQIRGLESANSSGLGISNRPAAFDMNVFVSGGTIEGDDVSVESITAFAFISLNAVTLINTATQLYTRELSDGQVKGFYNEESEQPKVAALQSHLINYAGNSQYSIDQEGTSGAGVNLNLAYVLDQWNVGLAISAGSTTLLRSNVTRTGATTQHSLLLFPAGVTYGVNDQTFIRYPLEGLYARDLLQGLYVSFYAMATVTGTYGFSLRNLPVTDSYVVPLVLTANIWKRFDIPIPTPQGTYTTDNTTSMLFSWAAGSGANLQTANTNQWVSGNFILPVITSPATVNFHIAEVMISKHPATYQPNLYNTDLAFAHRYLERKSSNAGATFVNFSFVHATGSTSADGMFQYSQKRTNAAITSAAFGNFEVAYTTGPATPLTSISFFNAGDFSTLVRPGYTGPGPAVGSAGILRAANSAVAYIQADSRL